MRTIKTIADKLPRVGLRKLARPAYTGASSEGIALAVESMREHMTDEGWQIMLGLEAAGYQLCGYQLPVNNTNVKEILAKTQPGVVFVQDKREWDVRQGDFREHRARFHGITSLQEDKDLFKVTILKDSHQKPPYHRQSAEEMGVHAWVIYYHPDIVMCLAPYLRREHLIRTYHSVDTNWVPAFDTFERQGCLLSGARMPRVYPFRERFIREHSQFPHVVYHSHPGYHRNHCCTPKFLQELSRYKVAICTSSVYGYALRKIIEATACGCIVVTDLPSDEILPEIDGNLVRIEHDISTARLAVKLATLQETYNPERQADFAALAQGFYDYRAVGARLAGDIEQMRSTYNVDGPR